MLAIALFVVCLASISAPAAARPWLCLPPVFDGGQRLHELPSPRIFWLELLLRQHELCWRRPATAAELRIVLVGNSAVYGFPLAAEHTFAAVLNEHFAAGSPPARVFNLAFVNPYQVRDALVINESLAYGADVVLYPLTLAEFSHIAPLPFPTIVQFFDSNRHALAKMVADPPPGLSEPFANYGSFLERPSVPYGPTEQLREAGTYLRLGAQAHAKALVARLHSPLPPFRRAYPGRPTGQAYDCAKVASNNERSYRDWTQWNILAYLESLRRTRGVEVLVVNWPTAHEPNGECYNVRYTNAALQAYVSWLRSETSARGIPYLDLHDLLSPADFLDSLHPSANGHRQIADAIARGLDPILAEIAERRAPRGGND